MAKTGREKNTKNKAKHSRLMEKKQNKKKEEEANRKARLKAIIQKANAEKENGQA
ncbi:hypothetical protein Q4566_03240 [Tamlana sp. 2_MG-2023]|uniref:Uncharacterized protein n=1 Tax=Pseudotamlana agarivorans TaxID=481183 RepID=A0ACC5UBS6_9FLAO|nr:MULTISPECIES: hypothetical protein [Tamlana]MBU2951735.1 hypothetical protein [Tamlana agarivorans]MDO6759201.1 hypothetical protein [Tamlana sp. 2_MG-2023]MDO6790660.1 hypothetical protein [Tamlana sp. 1_MG-2023]